MKNFVEINRTFTVKKNLLIFKSSFYEKLKLLIIPMMLITLGVGQMWATVTIYAVGNMEKKGGGWVDEKTAMYCHNWGSSATTWPGQSMTKWNDVSVDGHQVWTCNLKADGNTGCIFNNNGGWQTNDITNLNATVKAYPYPTYLNGTWYYSPRVCKALWESDQHAYGGRIYFDNSSASWGDTYMYFVIGHGSYVGYYRITNIGNTKLYYVDLGSQSWGDSKYVAVVGNSSSKTTGSGNPNNLAALTHFSDAYQYSLEYESTYLVSMSSGTNCSQISMDYKSGGYSDFNSTQTINTVVKAAGGSYTSANSKATISITSYEMTGDGAVTKRTPSISTSAKTATVSAARTATTTLEVGEVATGYQFDGWYTGATSGTKLSSSTTYTYYPTAATTVYARFSEKTFTVTVTNDGHGTTSPSGAQSNKGQITGVAVSATPSDGYNFNNWTITSGTGSFADATDESTTFYPTGTATIRANFVSAATSTLSVTATTGGSITTPAAGYYSDITTTGYSIAASRSEGYKFTGWTKTAGDGAVSFSDASSLSTTATITTLGDVTVTAGFAAMSNSLSVSSSTLYAGDNITLSATRTNHSLNLTYQYKIGSGSWTDIATQSGTSKTWQIPYANTYQTYKFRVKSTDGSTSFYSAEQTVNVKGRIIIHVKNTNSWASLYLYSWYSSTTTNGAWPGKTGTGLNNQSCSIHATGSQWWDVTITQETATAQKFILNCNTSGDKYKTGDLNLSDFTHDAYYAMSTNPSSNQTLSTTTTPAAPTLSTSDAGTIRETSAVLGGNVTNLGNDIISERGYYWSTNSALSSSNLGVGTKVTVSGTQSATGTFNNTKSSLTAGTKYYFIAYAKNGYGTSYGAVNNFTTLSTYTVTVTAGAGGTASPSSVTTGQYLASGTITASPSTGYTFYNWTKTSGDGTVTFTNANANSTTVKATSDATVQANFVDTWNLKGDQWGSDWSEYKPLTATANDNEYSVSLSLTKGTKYQFKVVKRTYNGSGVGTTDVWYGNTNGAGNKVFARGGSSFTTVANGVNNNLEVTADVTGTYTFTISTSGSTPVITVTYPTAYTITYGVGTHNGSSTAISVSPSFTSGDYVLPETDVTFSKGSTKTGYTWKGWYSKNDGTGTLHSSTDANLSWTATRTGNISVYACYNLVNYTITYNLNGGSNPVSPAPATSFTIESAAITLPTPSKTGYTFNGWYENADLSTGGVKTTIPAGSTGNKVYYAKWTPITYTIRFNGRGNTSGSMSNQTGVTYDASTTITANAFVKTGYNFAGWATTSERAAAGTVDRTDGAAHGNLSSTQGATVDLYAVWTPKQSALTLDKQTGVTGYGGSAGTVSTSPGSATYDAAMPTLSGTMPTAANGYAFMGFYDATGGGGTKYYNADGSSAHNWDKNTESGTTLYAYYKKAEITAITFDAAVVETKGTVSFAVTVSPTPTGDTKLCFTVLHSNDNPLAEQPTIKYSAGKYSFTAPEASGTYKVEAVLRTGTGCDGGTELDTEVANFQVAGIHTVTVQFKCGDEIIKASETVTGRPLDPTEITAPEIVGYAFSKWKAGDGITIEGADGNGEKASATINFTAIYDGKLTAIYTQKRMIYFYNTLNWENVYVYFYKNDSYWGASNQGTGANTTWTLTNTPYGEGLHGQMLPVEEGSKIYYFDAEEAGVNASYTNVAFTELDQHGCDYFYNNNKVVRRGDYHATTMPLFVPLSDQPEVKKNSNAASYYCEGYWMNYPANTGYTLRIYDSPYADNATGASREFLIPFSEDVKMPLKQEVEVNFSGKSWFIIYRNDGTYLEGSHTFKQTDHGDKKITSNADASKAKKMTLISDGSGIYTFTLTFRGDGGSPENYDYYLNVDFPAAVGDYRIVYKDNATWANGAHGNNYATWYHPSDIISKNKSATEAKEDTVSFFVSHGYSPAMKFQRIASISESEGSYGQITWEDVPSGAITIPTSITEAGVYNFIVSQPAGGASISLVSAEPYTGNYYIRTDCAGETKWNNFRAPDHQMNYSEYSIDHGGYSHYYTHWVQTDDKKNIQFCIANDYSSAISDTLIRESNAVAGWENINTYINSDGDILRNANVRFMWNQSTNKVSRAYVDGAQDEGSRFLVISSTDGMIKKADGSALSNNEVTFSDNENWIYEANVKAQPNALIKLKSTWGTSNTIEQYFKGSSTTTEKLIGGSGSLWYDIRILYDFKTNRLIASYIPVDENITTEKAIEADIMFIREHQGDIAQLTFGESGKISKIETAYGVMRFNKWTLANKSKEEGHAVLGDPKSIYERSLYWISFPFRVKLSEVIGFGTYGTHWAIQRYDGAGRAANGYWAESSSFWRWMNRNTEYLEPNQGYLLAIDVDLLGESSDVWGPESRSEQIEIYFPSYGTMPDITKATVTCTIPSHACTINWAATQGLPETDDPRTSYNRTVFDSHWNVISVPTYVNTNDVTFANTTWTGQIGPNFLYTWNADDHTITATSASGYTYHAMHAYMVQYGGNITWDANHVSSIVARKTYAESPSRVEFRLELQQNEQMIDRTYVALSNDEQTSAGFRFGEDMTKEFNANKSAIYTFIPNVATVAGNTLPMSDQTTIVPVGVTIKTAGDYTFAIPSGTEGIGVTLIDTETGIRTSLSALDYTVNLTAGKHDGRFVLEISPIQQMPTDIDQLPITNDQSSVKKVLIDGLLYIVKDGQLFDATGKVVTR